MLSNIDDDEASLFGSPPSSPCIGRSPSPALALPSSSESIVDLQNVGTIALPGSHCSSELSVKPLALPLNPLPQRTSSRPLSQPPASFNHFGGCPLSVRSPASTPSSSRASSQGPSKGKRSRRKREDEHPLRPPPPEIPLPDPNAPPPTNWLRSQSALLGHAGLVGGVNTATLSNRHSRGSSAVNPIVIDDENRVHTHRQSAHPTSIYIPSFTISIPPELPAPSPQEVVQILVKQREIFPVLKDLLKLSQGKRHKSVPAPLTAPDTSAGPMTKKRKLNKVPAGAADWDVPYPFKPGEGPRNYSETWEVTRQRQLISQLTSLIKSASRKAALRKYLEQNPHLQMQSMSSNSRSDLPVSLKKEMEHAMPKVDGHYRPDTVFYGVPTVSQPEILADSSNSPTKLDVSSSSPAPESSPFDDLLAELLAIPPSSSGTGSRYSDLPSLFTNLSSKESTPELDPTILDNWMSIFEKFEMPTSFPGDRAAFSTVDFPMDDTAWNTFSDDLGIHGLTTYSSDPSTFARISDWTATSTDISGLQSNTVGIDPTIPDSTFSQLNISIPPTLSTTSNLSALSGTPSLIYSPIPSLASFGEVELLTPEFNSPDLSIVTGQNEDHVLSSPNKCGPDGSGRSAFGKDVSMSPFEGSQDDNCIGPAAEQNTQIADVTLGVLDFELPPQPASVGTSSVFTPPVVRPFRPSDRSSNKAELLQRAKERRVQLAEELIKARTQLWETTIEHGVLTRLAKHYS